MSYDLLQAHCMLPRRDCDTCTFKKDPDGGWCYMFRTEPKSDFCGQYTKGPQFAAQEPSK